MQDELRFCNVADRGELETERYVSALQTLAQALQLGYECQIEAKDTLEGRLGFLNDRVEVRRAN